MNDNIIIACNLFLYVHIHIHLYIYKHLRAINTFSYATHAYSCAWVTLNTVVTYIYNVNIVYSRKLHYVRITCGHDSSSYTSEEISEKKTVMYFYQHGDFKVKQYIKILKTL